MNLDDWREATFQLAWHQHGGSGLAVTRAEVLEMTPAERNWNLRRVAEERAREAKAIERAGKGK